MITLQALVLSPERKDQLYMTIFSFKWRIIELDPVLVKRHLVSVDFYHVKCILKLSPLLFGKRHILDARWLLFLCLCRYVHCTFYHILVCSITFSYLQTYKMCIVILRTINCIFFKLNVYLFLNVLLYDNEVFTQSIVLSLTSVYYTIIFT